MKKISILIVAFFLIINCFCQTSENYYNKGYKKMSLDDKGATEDFTKAIEINPKNYKAYFYRGEVNNKLKNYRNAISDFSIVYDIIPEDITYDIDTVASVWGSSKKTEIDDNHTLKYFALRRLVEIKNEIRDYKGAIIDCNLLIARNFDDKFSYYERGIAKNGLNEYNGAIDDFTLSIKLDGPTWYYIYYDRGLAKFNIQDYIGAIKDYNEVITLTGPYKEVYFNRGLCKVLLNDYRGAIVDFNVEIEKNPNFETAYYNRGLAKIKLDDYSGAILDYNVSIRINPKAKNSYMNRGLAKISIGEKSGGCLDLSKAGELGVETAYEAIKKLCN